MPTRWKVDENDKLPIGVIEDTEDGLGVCTIEYDPQGEYQFIEQARATAAQIVREHNAHEAMRHALRTIEAYMEAGQVFDKDGNDQKNCHLHRSIQAALRLAKGE